MTAPPVLLGAFDHTGAHRVKVNICGKFLQVLVSIDKDRLVSSLEQMSCFVVSPVEPLDVPLGDALHDLRKRDIGDL